MYIFHAYKEQTPHLLIFYDVTFYKSSFIMTFKYYYFFIQSNTF
jgi:hypothetical protein